MSGKLTIKEVYDQLPKGDLWAEKARIKYFDQGSERHYEALIMTLEPEHGVLVHCLDRDDYFMLSTSIEVEWIGNKPKTKKLYACIRKMKTDDGEIQYLAFEDKDWFQNALQWLPEDQYPPIEVE